MKTNITKTTKSGLEIATCSRCGGSGQYSFCYSHGTRCFKCSGSGAVYTARGLATLNFLNALRSKPASEIKVGDIVREDFGCPTSSMSRAFGTVTEVKPSDCKRIVMVDGVRTEVENGQLAITIVHPEHGSMTTHIPPTDMFRMKQTDEQVAATLKQALEFQLTLTKAGKPAKRKA